MPAACLAALSLGGCAEMGYNGEPRAMQLSSNDAPTALILGQAYKESAGHYNILIVKSVDGTRTFSGFEARTPYNWYVPAGPHKLTAFVSFGNFARSLEGDPELAADVHAGRAYQLYAKQYEDSNGKPFVKLWLEEVGSVKQFEELRERDPDSIDGRPLTRRRLTTY
jgi:hypothetical protein